MVEEEQQMETNGETKALTPNGERERVRCILLLGLEIHIECNKQGIINEILVGMLALMRVFFFYRWIYLNPMV